MADSLLRLLGPWRATPEHAQGFCTPVGGFWLPIHPAVGQALALPFASADRPWAIFDSQLTHREYTLCYLACRANNVADF